VNKDHVPDVEQSPARWRNDQNLWIGPRWVDVGRRTFLRMI